MQEKPTDNLRGRIDALVEEVSANFVAKDIEAKAQELESLRGQMNNPDFWDNSQEAQSVSKNESKLAHLVEPWLDIQRKLDELNELAGLGDASLENDISQQLDDISKQLAELQQSAQFEGPYDDHDVIINVYAGAGGTDAQDWTQMLGRMYLRWAESHSYKTEMLDQSSGEEAGLKNLSLAIRGGDHLYGRLIGEAGVHRLVRMSPFNSKQSRETSFAKVEVLPEIDQPGDLEIDEKDLKIDVFRSGGAGGQSVNTTDSAVRVTHIPTGITVSIQNERSQLQNKETAMAILRSRLVALQLEQHVQNLDELKGPKQSAEFGHAFRHYFLHPSKRVKDDRSGYETSNAEAVLDGDLDPLIEASLTVPRHDP